MAKTHASPIKRAALIGCRQFIDIRKAFDIIIHTDRPAGAAAVEVAAHNMNADLRSSYELTVTHTSRIRLHRRLAHIEPTTGSFERPTGSAQQDQPAAAGCVGVG